jgi:hypothetical protein
MIFFKHTMVDVAFPIFLSSMLKAKKPTLGPY